MIKKIEILTNIKNIATNTNHLEMAIRNIITNIIRREYNKTFEKFGAKLVSADVSKSGAIPAEAKMIQKIAFDWNYNIRRNIIEAFNDWTNQGAQLNSNESCELKYAVISGDNTPHPCACYMLFNMLDENNETDFKFSTIMQPNVITDIQNKPQNYRILDIYVECE